MDVLKTLSARAIVCAFVVACALMTTQASAQDAEPLDPPLCERSEALQAAILQLTDNSADRCDSFPANVMREATSLDASNMGISDLKSGDFRDFDALTSLDLSNNSLRRLRNSIFSNLDNLETLNLENNQLRILQISAFNGLDNLQTLNLWNNELTYLSEEILSVGTFGVFRDLGELTALSLGKNNLSSFAVKAFQGLHKLEVLQLRENGLQTLPDKAWLDDLDALQVLNLTDNRLRALQEAPFSPVRGTLRQLILADNRLTYLPPKMFEGLNLNPKRSGFRDGALRLEGNDQGDGNPLGANPDGRTTTSNEKFTLPMYLWTLVRQYPFNASRWNLFDLVGRMPHAAPFDLNLVWPSNDDLDGDITAHDLNANSGMSAAVDANQLDAGSLEPQRGGRLSGADVIFPKNTSLSLDWGITPRSALSTSDCGFNPCYNGFGFHSHGVTDLSGGTSSNFSPRLPVISGAAFTSAPADSDGYVAGEDVEVEVTFTVGPIARFDPLSVRLQIGDNAREAEWVPTQIVGDGPLRFRYRITEEDGDSDGIEVLSMSRDHDTDNFLRESGQFGSRKNFNLAANAAHKVYGGPYVSFVSDAVSGKEGETVHLNLRVTPAPASDLVVNYRARRPGEGGTHWGDYDTEGSTEDDGSLRIRAGETGGRIVIRIVDRLRNGHDNREPERASEYFYMDIEDGEGYERGVRRRMTVVIKEGVCDRTPRIQELLMRETGRGDCGDVTDVDLASIGELHIDDKGITSLKRGDFLGLEHLTMLDMQDNRINALPAGMFSGLSNLDTLFLDNNPGADFPVRLRLESVGEKPEFPLASGTRVDLKAVVREGAPWGFAVRLVSTSTSNVSQLDTYQIFAQGAVESQTFTWVAAEETSRIEIRRSRLPGAPDSCPVTEEQRRCFRGLRFTAPEQFSLSGGTQLKVRVFLEGALE